jgi:hydrogenase maturation protease
LKKPATVLIYGYGNPGRQDDGLGNALVEKMEQWVHDEKISTIAFDSNYQLNVEDAEAISHKDLVVFVDASDEPIDDFRITRVNASEASVEFTMHAVSPSFILHLCNHLFDKYPDCYLLHIKGYNWEVKECLSGKANANLLKAFDFLCEKLRHPEKRIERFSEVVEC